jgi:hypothetical protein
MYTYAANVWGLSIVQRPFSVISFRSVAVMAWGNSTPSPGGCSGQRACPHASWVYTGDGSRADSGIPPAASRQLHSLTHAGRRRRGLCGGVAVKTALLAQLLARSDRAAGKEAASAIRCDFAATGSVTDLMPRFSRQY